MLSVLEPNVNQFQCAPFTAMKISDQDFHLATHLIQVATVPGAAGNHSLLMGLNPPRSDEHTTLQHAEHLSRILQRAPLSRWLH